MEDLIIHNWIIAMFAQKVLEKYKFNRYLFAPQKSRKHFNEQYLMQIHC